MGTEATRSEDSNVISLTARSSPPQFESERHRPLQIGHLATELGLRTTTGRPRLHKDWRSALAFLGIFVGFLVLLALASLGGWWYLTHVRPHRFWIDMRACQDQHLSRPPMAE